MSNIRHLVFMSRGISGWYILIHLNIHFFISLWRHSMGTIGEFLGSDHRTCDDLFASAEAAVAQKSWDSARSLFERFQAALAHHLAMEEAVLFPAFESRTGMSARPTQVMRMEHEQMRGLLRDMASAVTEGNQDSYLGLSETLNMLMQQH